jgi:ketosteroid isomerase-like protein
MRGHAEVIESMEKWTELFDEWSVEVYEFVDLHPWVVCDLRWRGKGKGSDAEVDWRVADAYEVRDGQIARAIHNFPDLATATAVVRATLKTVKGSRD